MKGKQSLHSLLAYVMLAATTGLTMTACTDKNDNSAPGQNQWGSEELVLTVGDTDLKLKFVEGGDYSMLYQREGQEKTFTGSLSDYYMASTEVANKLWAAVMGVKPEGQPNDGDMYPVTMITYTDIVGPGGFLEKLNALVENQLPDGKLLALPTEAQWQYAAQGGKHSMGYSYSGSNTIGDVAWYADNSDSTTHPVASRQPNELGLYDMSGNVWERCSDWFAPLDELPVEHGLDYAGPAMGHLLIGRGGCFDNAPATCVVTYHGREVDTLHNAPTTTVGFRIVLAAPSNNFSTSASTAPRL